jgi:WD40 repeat protein
MNASTTFRPSDKPFPSFPRLGRVFGEKPFRTDADIQAVSFGPDGLSSVEECGVLRRWDAATGRQFSWHALDANATLWTFRPDGQILAGASVDLTLWDVASGRQRAMLPQHSWTTAVAFAPDSDLVATGHDDGVICIWDAADGQVLRRFRGYQRPVSALAFCPDGRRLASAAEDRLIFVWNVSTGQIEGMLGGHTDRIPALAWHPDGRRLVSAGWDTTARVWDTESFEPIILLNSHASQVFTLALSRDGTWLACADSANAVHLWDLRTNELHHVFHGAKAELSALAFNSDGTRLVAGGADRCLHVWDPRRGERLDGSIALPATGTSVSLSPDGRALASLDGAALRVYDSGNAKLLFEGKNESNHRAVAYSPAGRLFAIAGDVLELRDAATGTLQTVLEGPRLPVAALAFAADGALLAAGGTGSADIWIWELAANQPALLIPDAVAGCVVQALAFHPSQPLLAVAGCDWEETTGCDGRVNIWHVGARRREVLLGGGALAIAFDPTGRRLAVACLDRTLRIWDLAERQLVGEWTGHTDAVRSLAYSPDSRWLASAGDDRTVRIWDPRSGRPLGIVPLAAHVGGLCFAPDGRSLFTGNGDGSCCQIIIDGGSAESSA